LTGLCLLTLGLGCQYTRYKNPEADPRHNRILSKEETNTLGYQKVAQQVFEPYCISCHTGGPIPLNSYSEVTRQSPEPVLNLIRNAVFVKGTMPPDRLLPAEARSLLLAWLDKGAPEHAKIETPPPSPLVPTFSSIRDRIFKIRCGDCHNPASPYCSSSERPSQDGVAGSGDSYRNKESCRMELANYQELLFGEEARNKELVIPGNAEESQLILSIQSSEGAAPSMPPPEDGYTPLSSEEVQIIKDWINAGAKNN
jgi:hypothetical protein